MIGRSCIVVIAMVLLAIAVHLSRKTQTCLIECRSEHDPRWIGDGGVLTWGTAQAKYPQIPNYRAGAI